MFLSEAVTIDSITPHPTAPLAKIIRFKDQLYQVVTASLYDYKVGERVLYISDCVHLPEWLLKSLDLWDNIENKGFLKGERGDAVCFSYFQRDKTMFSYGMLVPLEHNCLETPDGPVDVDDPNFNTKVGLTPVIRGTQNWFLGDYFLYALDVPKVQMCDMEYLHKQFVDQPVMVQEYIYGRRFYITVCARKSDHRAFGTKKNIFISTDEFEKHRFLSNTLTNHACSFYTQLFKIEHLDEVVQHILEKDSNCLQYTFVFVVRGTQRLSHTFIKAEDSSRVYLVDIYRGEKPFGAFLPQEQVHETAKTFGLHTPTTWFEDLYNPKAIMDFTTQHELRGVVLRALSSSANAVYYNPNYRISYVQRFA